MTVTSVTKDGGYLVIVEDGVTTRRSIVYEDTVVSEPPTSYEEVGNIYVDAANSKLVIQYNDSTTEIELDATTDLTGAEIVALLEALASGSRLEITYLDDGSTYLRFTATERTKLAGIEAGATKYPDTGEQAFLDADHNKLDGIETGATADLTGAEIVALLEALTAGSRLSHTKLDDLTSGDPHTQYQKESEKDAASGYAGLDASSDIAESVVPEHMSKNKLAWTADKLLKGAGAGTNPTEIDVPSAEPGEGHIVIHPPNTSAIGQGTWVFAADASCYYGWKWYNTSNANGDNFSYKVYLAAGTYTLQIFFERATNGGIVDFYIDADEVGSVDMYGAGAYNVAGTVTSISVATSGLKTLKLQVDGKSGSDYYIRIIDLVLWRTA